MFVLNESPSIADQFLFEIRDKDTQKDRMRFRRNLERIGELLAYEISKELKYENKSIETPFGEANCRLLEKNPVLISIMRAGIPFHQGFLNYFDNADKGFIGAYRDYREEGDQFKITTDYIALPGIGGKRVIILDPMLATGQSVVAAVEHLMNNGQPEAIHIAAAIAAPEGIEYISKNLSPGYSLWVGAIDKKLNDKAYIIPGLGDAGDLAFGPKD